MMKLNEILAALRELPPEAEENDPALLAEIIETAVEQKQRILGRLYGDDGEREFSVTFAHGSAEYRIEKPRYEEAEFIKNKRRGPGGKYFPFIEIEVPCHVTISAAEPGQSFEAEGRVNLHDGECTVDSAMIPIPEKAMEMLRWHCREYSFLLDEGGR